MAECNDYEGLRINPTPSSIGNQYAGVSTDEKPASAPTYSVYLELDTGKFYYYDGTEWKEIPCCGGGSDEPTSENFKIALVNDVMSSITADEVGIVLNNQSNSLQDLINFGLVTIDSDNVITFPVNANGSTFNFRYIGTNFTYGLAHPGTMPILISESYPQSDSIVIESNVEYLVARQGK